MTDKRLGRDGGELLDLALEMLRDQHSITHVSSVRGRLDEFARLLLDWSEPLSLLSTQDRVRVDEHIADSLSLVPFVAGCSHYVDIGSGGGLPGIPVAAVLDDIPTTLIERNTKKVGFLRKVVARLNLAHVSICHGSFPAQCPNMSGAVISARAMESPAQFYKQMRERLPVDARLLYQGAHEPGQYFPSDWVIPPVQDVWSEKGLRRGRLMLIEHRDR